MPAGPTLNDFLLFTVGLAVLGFGADWLVRGASAIAEKAGVSPLIVGLTIVAFGTSAPELMVSGQASLDGLPGVAVGNVMGSTAANVGLIVGIGALVRPIVVQRRLMVAETPFVIFVLTLVVLLSLNDALGRIDGGLLVIGWAAYLVFLLKWHRGRERPPSATVEDTPGFRVFLWPIAQLLVSLPALGFGANWLLDGAHGIAIAWRVPEPVIAATLMAIGTSLPELASTIMAAVRSLSDIAIGNIIGSNVFNLGLVLGTAALLRPLGLHPSTVVMYVLPALVFSALLIPLALSKGQVGRVEGLVLLLLYVAYISWLVATSSPRG